MVSGLIVYRNDSPYPNFASGMSAGPNAAPSPYSKPLTSFGVGTLYNPQLTNNQDSSPRDKAVVSNAGVTEYATFNVPTFVMILIIVAGIYFLSRS